MRLHVETTLGCPADAAFAAVQTSQVFADICAGWCTFKAVDAAPLPDRWREGQQFRLKPFIFGLIPSGVHEFKVVRVDPVARQLHFSERDAVVTRWEHSVRVLPAGAGTCLYADSIDFDAGALTPLVWLWSRAFYRMRQRRLRRLLSASPSRAHPSSPRP